MKTVAFLLSSLHCNDGIASHCQSLMEALRLQGWKIIIISGGVTGTDISSIRYQKLQELSEHWEVVDNAAFSRFRPKVWWRLRSIVQQYGVSILHCHGFSALPLARVLYFLTGLRSVAAFHGGLSTEMLSRKDLAKYQLLCAFTAPKRILATALELQDWFVNDVRQSRERVVHAPLGIDTEYFRIPTIAERADARQKLGVDVDTCVFVLNGRLSWIKGHRILIDAAAQLQEKFPEHAFKVIFVGSGSDEAAIRDYAAKIDASGKLFDFLGFISAVNVTYWGADVCVLPSSFEGFAASVAEAMCCGLAAIRTPAGGSRDQIVDGQTGFIVPFDDADALAVIMQRLLEDPALRARVAQAGSAYASRVFSLEAMALSTIAAYTA